MIDSGIDPDAQAAGRMVVHDLARRRPERHRIFGIDPAFDGMAVKFHFVLRQCEVVAGGDADLLDDEVDVGDHLGHRMLDLDAGVHFDEVELAVLVEEFDGADAEIFDLAHRLGDSFADLITHRGVERRRGAFLPDLLVAPLQRAVALAEMNGAACASARATARPAANSASARISFMPRPPPPDAALSINGKPTSRARRNASASEATPPSEPGTTGMPSASAVRLAAILSPIRRICSGRGPMKCTLCSPRISAKRAFSERKP